MPGCAAGANWAALGVPRHELNLSYTLPTGQSFRWRQTGPDVYTGVLGTRLVQLRQADNDVQYRVIARGDGADAAGDWQALQDYFNLGVSMSELCAEWAARDQHFKKVAPFFQGARMLRQDPTECLFQFICSSNNHISRIQGMVERLCSSYGTPLQLAGPGGAQGGAAGAPAAAKPSGCDDKAATGHEAEEDLGLDGLSFYAFPTLDQLAEASDEALRDAGFGYRAKFITGSVGLLRAKPGGGEAWLASLRGLPYAEAHEALCTLPGVGPKVSACVCLFALDKADAIPVDTHVWQLAVRHYAPKLAGKTLSAKLHPLVQQAFVDRFGPYAGWAHQTLFVSELSMFRDVLPAKLTSPSRKKKAAASSDSGSESDDSAPAKDQGGASAAPGSQEGGPVGRSKRARRASAGVRAAVRRQVSSSHDE